MKFIGFIVGVLLTAIGFWLGGYDFNERGFTAFYLYICCLSFGILGTFLADILRINQ